MEMRILALLLLTACWPLLAPAAQQVNFDDAQATLNALAAIPNPEKQLATLTKMESQFITFADGAAGIRFRYMYSGWFGQRVCWFVPLDSRMQSYLQVIAAGQPVQSYTNAGNDRWFVSNMLNATFSQSDLDWCTQ